MNIKTTTKEAVQKTFARVKGVSYFGRKREEKQQPLIDDVDFTSEEVLGADMTPSICPSTPNTLRVVGPPGQELY